MGENVNACGLSCPQPALLTRQALEAARTGEVVVEVDTMTQVQNCSRTGVGLGWEVKASEDGGVYRLTFTKAAAK